MADHHSLSQARALVLGLAGGAIADWTTKQHAGTRWIEDRPHHPVDVLQARRRRSWGKEAPGWRIGLSFPEDGKGEAMRRGSSRRS